MKSRSDGTAPCCLPTLPHSITPPLRFPFMRHSENLLMVANSDHDANMLYAVGMFVPDPFIFLRLDGKNLIVLSDLEIDRARRSATHCEVLSLSTSLEQLRKNRVKKPKLANVVAAILRE